MRGTRAFVAAAAAFSVFFTALSPGAYAATSKTQAAQILALKAKLAGLQHKYDQQEQRIDRLEHMFDEAFGAQHPQTTPAQHVAVRPPASAALPSVSVGVTEPVQTPAPVAAAPAPAQGQVATAPQQGTTQFGATAPKTQSQQAVYRQQNALFVHGLTLTPGLSYSYADNRLFTLNGFLALGAIFLGNIDVTRQENTIAEPNITADYSFTPGQQVEVDVPWVWRASTYDAQGAQNSTALVAQNMLSVGHFGDLGVGYYYQLPKTTIGGPTFVLNTHVSIPTGTPPYGIKIIQTKQNGGNLSYPSSLPTGTGLYTLSAGATIIQQADPAILYGGLNLYHNFENRFGDISTSPLKVTPGYITGGDAAVATLGTAFALNDKVSTSFSIQDTLVEPTRARAVGGQWSTVVGSSLNAAVFNIGTTFSTSPTSYWQAVAGIGMTQDAPNFGLSLRFPQGP
jgi:hypothetical protein